MPIEFIQGNIFDSKLQTLVAAVNTRGIAGAGIVLQFKHHFPGWFNDYLNKCKSGEIKIGSPALYKSTDQWVLNFPTKDDWRQPFKIEYISAGLKTFVDKYEEWGITSIALPALGSGLGGLPWPKVEKLMVNHLSKCKIPVHIYLPIELKGISNG